MNGRSDASTSTDDVKGRPLCLFYFSQPLGVLAAEPPRAAPCPAHLYRAHMAPAWEAWPPAPAPAAAAAASPAPRRRRDTLSSSLFSSDAWLGSSASSHEFPRRVVPYHALLPPLRLPAPAPPEPDAAPAEAWPLRSLQPERFSLPPIELPRLGEPDQQPEDSAAAAEPAPEPRWGAPAPQPRCASSGRLSRRATPRRPRRAPPGVHKPRRRARPSALRRTITHLMQRTIKGCLFASGGESASSCCVRAALRTLRAAWPPAAPAPPARRAAHACRRRPGSRADSASASSAGPPAGAAAMPPAPAPPLLRRRYSVPEIIMRKYRLAQQNPESEGQCPATSPSPSPAACAGCGRCARRGDRELMRKSALLRRLWGPAPRASRSLHGSSSELRRSPAGSGWASPKRQRLDAASPPRARASPACSDCTFASHRPRSPASPPGPASPARPERDVFARYSDLAAAPPSPPPAPPAPPARRSPGARSATDTTDTLSDSLPTAHEARPPCDPPPFVADAEADRYASLPLEVLSAGSPPYEVLEIVVSETVEPAASPRRGASPRALGARHVNIDEYVSNILVESLNSLSEQLESMSAAVGGAGVVVEKEIKVRLQNTGINTIVHLSPTSNHQIIFGNEELCHEDNAAPRDACNNPRVADPEANNNEPPDAVNRAVLQQIQKLFHDELYRLDPADPYPGEPAIARIEVSNVDAFLRHECESGPPSAAPAAPPAVGVGAGNYWARAEPALVPRLSALPHSASMEVNTSSSDAEPSACPSLVDSLDDPASPRAPPSSAPPPRRLARSAVDVLALLPDAPRSPPTPAPAAFFVRITDDDCDCEKRDVVVADRMPDTIRERLLRRQRKREQRMEHARRGRSRARSRAAERDARAAVAALVDELIAKAAQDEYRCMRGQQRRAEPAPPARRAERRGRPAPQPAGEPRRIYQKSEIHDGDKCIEILEILEYVDDSQNSPETTNSDERHGSTRSRRSKIPVPVYERIQRTSMLRSKKNEEYHPRSPPPGASPPSPPAARRASVPPPAEPRARAGSLRFRRVFDIIPEERAAPAESPGAAERRVSAPALPAPAAPATRSAATSPPAPQRASRSTMTSPRRAARSPPPPPPPPRPAAGSNGNLNERTVAKRQRRASLPGRAPAAGAAAPRSPAGAAAGALARACPGRRPGPRQAARRSSSSGSDSGGSSLLCAAPRWLAARRRRPRPPRAARAAPRPGARPAADGAADGAGGWTVTVAGSCRAALPADVEMRLRFPRDAPAPRAAPAAPRNDTDATPRRSVATRSDETGTTECWCRCCSCGAPAPAPAALPAAPALPPHDRRASLTLAMKKDDTKNLVRKGRKKSSYTHLPELEAARGAGGAGGAGGGAGGERRRHSGKMRRACSLQCWLPAAAPRRGGAAELAVEGSAIVPELKPRAPSMSERDLTRHPAHPAHHAHAARRPWPCLRS